jgi:hypothetical protein
MNLMGCRLLIKRVIWRFAGMRFGRKRLGCSCDWLAHLMKVSLSKNAFGKPDRSWSVFAYYQFNQLLDGCNEMKGLGY